MSSRRSIGNTFHVTTVTDGTNGTNGKDGKDGKDGAEGYGLKLTLERSGRYSDSSWNTWGTIGRSEPWGKIDGDSDFTACRVGDYFIVTGTSTDKGIRHTEEFRCTSVSASSITGICVSHVKDGQEGSRGRIGRFFYYVGTWTGDTVKTYIVNDAQAPYFKYGSNYFVFNPETNGNYTESQMGTPSTSSSNWDIMTNDFKYIITEALFVKTFANFGSFIISEDWLISQNGTVNGSSSGAYTQFDKDYPNTNHYNSSTGRYNFIPNVAINGETGEVYMQKAHISGDVSASSGKIGDLTIGYTTDAEGIRLTRLNGPLLLNNGNANRQALRVEAGADFWGLLSLGMANPGLVSDSYYNQYGKSKAIKESTPVWIATSDITLPSWCPVGTMVFVVPINSIKVKLANSSNRILAGSGEIVTESEIGRSHAIYIKTDPINMDGTYRNFWVEWYSA